MTAPDGLIGSEAWARVLERGFGASWIESANDGPLENTAWSIFRRFGVSAGYADFPVGFEDRGSNNRPDIMQAVSVLRSQRVDIARFSSVAPEALDVPDRFRLTDLVETSIECLRSWDKDALPRAVRRKVAKSVAAGVSVRAAYADDGVFVHRMYAEMIARHRGSLRYTERYFDALCRLAAVDRRLSVGIAMDADEVPCGFIVAAHSKSTSHYLHAGFAGRSASLRPGYMAMLWAIQRSREYGSLRFNMLTSPSQQPSLVAYKESFGGVSYLRRHYEIPLTLRGNLAGTALNVVARVRHAIR